MKTHGFEFSVCESQPTNGLNDIVYYSFVLNSYYKTVSLLSVRIAKMTKKRKMEQRTSDGNYEKNEKIRTIRTKGHVSKENKKIEECSIYGNSYFKRTNDHLSFLSLSDTTDSEPYLETNSANY